MLKAYLSIIPIALSGALLAMGNGFMSSFIPTRMELSGFANGQSSDMVAAYAFGMLASCFFSAQIIRRVGHIRAFTTFAALSGLTVLLFPLAESYGPWLLMRFVNGYCATASFLVAQSWLNDQTESKYRGQILTMYYIIYLVGSGSGSFTFSQIGPVGLTPFMVGCSIFMVSLFPVVLTRLPAPAPPEIIDIQVRKLLTTSPVAFFGCFIGGATAMTMSGMGAIIGADIGLSFTDIGLLMALAQMGNIIQFPLGYLSDRIDRRKVLFICSIGLAFSGYMISHLDAENFYLMALIIGVFIGLGESTLTIALANANDRSDPTEYTSIAGTGSLIWCIGAIVGPMLGSLTLSTTGPVGISSFFVIISVLYAIYAFYRFSKFKDVPEEEQFDFYVAPSEMAFSETYSPEEEDTAK